MKVNHEELISATNKALHSLELQAHALAQLTKDRAIIDDTERIIRRLSLLYEQVVEALRREAAKGRK